MIWRGEIYDIDLGRPVGHELAFVRPAVVVSTDIVSNSPGEVVVVVPVGSRSYGLRSHVELDRGRSGLDHPSYARCDQVRSISMERLAARRGIAGLDEVQAIDHALRFILDL